MVECAIDPQQTADVGTEAFADRVCAPADAHVHARIYYLHYKHYSRTRADEIKLYKAEHMPRLAIRPAPDTCMAYRLHAAARYRGSPPQLPLPPAAAPA